MLIDVTIPELPPESAPQMPSIATAKLHRGSVGAPSLPTNALGMIALLVVGLLSSFMGGASATEFQTELVEAKDNVGEYLWLALDASGVPHFSYFNRTAGELRYATRGAGGTWNTRVIDGASPGSNVGAYTSMDFDSDGYPHIAYYDWANADLEYAWQDAAGWHTSTLDSTSAVGRYTNLRIAPNGTLHLIYYDEFDGDLEYARNDGAGWSLTTVDSIGTVGTKARMVLDSFGFPHVAYYDATRGALKYARYDGANWQIETPDDGQGDDVGSYASIVLDAQDRPHISYLNGTQWDLAYARFDGTQWNLSTVEGGPKQTGLFTSIQLDRGGRPVIAYFDLTDGDLRLARRIGSSWVRETVDSAMATGRHAAMLIDASGVIRIGYYNETRQSLKYAFATLAVATERSSFGSLRARY
jgi:hypothetical protein